MTILAAGTFGEDNPNHFGPTPEVGVLVTLHDNSPVNVAQWPDGRFEVAKNGRQFLVNAPELAALLGPAPYAVHPQVLGSPVCCHPSELPHAALQDAANSSGVW